MVKQDNSFEIYVSVISQTLDVRHNGNSVMSVAVSTAANGTGEAHGSECTPRGWHQVRAKIGDNCPANTIFVGRRPTGEVYTPELAKTFPERDWILTRILWLSGLEPGFNRMGNVDTMRRFIYMHGCPDEDAIGQPGSHGCIKMRNQDVIKIYDLVPVGTRVLITE